MGNLPYDPGRSTGGESGGIMMLDERIRDLKLKDDLTHLMVNDAATYHAIRCYQDGGCSFEDALVAALKHHVKHNKELTKQVIDGRIHRPIVIPNLLRET